VNIDTSRIFVEQSWDGWRIAEVRLADVHDVHWRQPNGAPRPLVHGYISCASILAGSLPHDCERTGGQHRLLVCVLKKHCAPSAYAVIAQRADASVKAVAS
jgi:hypothetical protein